jgi:hypothetical protein
MVERLKGTLKNELEALNAGNLFEENTAPKKAATPRKRKAKADGDEANGDATPTPKKRGRAKKVATPEAQADDDEEMSKVKDEVKDDE